MMQDEEHGFAPEEEGETQGGKHEEPDKDMKEGEEEGDVKHTMLEEEKPAAERVAPTEGTCEWRFHQMVVAFITHHDQKMALQKAHQASVKKWFAEMSAAYPLLTVPAWVSEESFGLTTGPMEVDGTFPGDKHAEFDEFMDFNFEEEDFETLEEALAEEEEQDSGL